MKIIFLISIALFSTIAAADDITSEIERLSSYSEFGGGDIIFTTKTKHATCYGYWLDPNYAGADKAYGMLLSAFHANTQVGLTLDTTVTWPGSSNSYCKLVRTAITK